MKDCSRCGEGDCLACACNEVLPGWCDGRCASCELVRECPCCNSKIRRQVNRRKYRPFWCREKSGSLAEVEVSIGQIACTGRWLQRPVTPELVKSMAAQLSTRGQRNPIKVRIRPGHTGKRVFELVNGEVRLRAAKALGWISIRCVVKRLDDWQTAAEYLQDNLVERQMPWEEVTRAILAMEQATLQGNGRRLDSRRLGQALGRSKDWINDHKRALQIIEAHGIPEGVIPHHKLLRPLRQGIPFDVEERILQGIINEKWTVLRVREEVEIRCSSGALRLSGPAGRIWAGA